ncbi:MAG: peroxiredoxin [Bacilli bacterium]|nr:peroxiredoxin [Bacilli bacterium]
MFKIGDYIEFSLPGSDGRVHKTEDYKGKVIVLYTYPKDLTPGCTTQACRFRDLTKEFAELNAVILGLNKDDLQSHEKFINKHQLTFPLLSDVNGELLDKLGAKEGSKVYRNTYVIDEEGELEKIYEQVKASENPDEVLAYLKERKA